MFFANNSLGFPDGHLTGFDEAMQIFYRAGIPVCLIFSIGFIFLGISASPLKTVTIILLCCFALVIVTGLSIYCYLAATLENGPGG